MEETEFQGIKEHRTTSGINNEDQGDLKIVQSNMYDKSDRRNWFNLCFNFDLLFVNEMVAKWASSHFISIIFID